MAIDEFTKKAIDDHYDHMQKHLPDNMTLYRGMNWSTGGGPTGANKKIHEQILAAHLNGKTHISLNHRPISGWSINKEIANDFGAGEKDGNGITLKRNVNKKDIVAGFGISPGFHQYPHEREYLVKADKINHDDLNKSKMIIPIKDVSTSKWGEDHDKFKTIEHYASSLSDKEKNRIKNINHSNVMESVIVAEIDPDYIHEFDNPLFDMFQATRARDIKNGTLRGDALLLSGDEEIPPPPATDSALIEGYNRRMTNR